MKLHQHIGSTIILSLLFGVAVGHAQEEGRNLIRNGGFEDWVKPNQVPTNCPVPNFPGGLFPKGFGFDMETRDDSPIGVTFTKDTEIKHDGSCSVKVENSEPKQAACLGLAELRIEPNTRYRGRIWTKWEGVSKRSGTGVSVVIIYGSPHNFWGSPSTKRERKNPNMGGEAGDWQPIEFTFQTGPAESVFAMSIYLQWTAGTAWFDDAELIAVGPVEDDVKK